MNTTLAKTLHWEKQPDTLDFDLNDLVKSASSVIVPLGPINTFAARNPWVGLEGQPFEKMARWLKDTCDVDIYPNDSVFQSARDRGEIDQDFLEKGFQHWLNSQSLELPREVAERFCRAALLQNQPYSSTLETPELKSMARKLNRFTSQMTEKHSVKTYSQRLEQLGRVNAAHELNRHIIKWCKLFLDKSQAVWSMPNREEGFYHAWRKLVQHDPALSRKVRKQLSELPEEADAALIEVLLLLEIPFSEIQDYFEAHFLALPGWGGMMLWRSQQSAEETSLLLDYLAVRISMEWALVKPCVPLPEKRNDKVNLEPLIAAWAEWGNLPINAWLQLSSTEIKARLALAYRFDKILRNRLLLEAWEKTYEDQLKTMITSQQPAVAAENVKPALAQFVFCIDVRSEPFRRKLEKAGDFETFGTAGFFGLPIETCELGSNHTHNSLPVMFKPQYKVKEFSPEFESFQQRHQVVSSLGYTFKTMKHNLVSSMVLPEISGPWLSLQTLARSFMPRSAGRTLSKLLETWLHKPSTELSLDYTQKSETDLPIGFSVKEKVHYVRQALKMMGLTDQFAPLVVICGHGSHSTNNPYRSALDCGACGGASSGFNARVLAALCNLPNVRKSLETEGIIIPKDTVFAAAEHITTLDELRWLYVPELSVKAKEAFKRVQAELPKVSEEANAERIPQLPNLGTHLKNPKAEAQRLSEDWSEVRPEWGLARNAAFIIGERRLTQDCNLGGRVFLNNYNWKKDKNGAILANIISGPATVAQWINLQYYASTVAPHYYGSGNKTTQTVTAGLGVMQGNASDLLSGLPWQSVMKSDEEAYHEPLRLLVVIQAPRGYVKRMLDHDHAFHQKVKNGWIRLASIDPEGHWESWS
nr:putative inorganic carbon transporter subunit DabA [Neobacillus sp. Marseille-Q6967]